MPDSTNKKEWYALVQSSPGTDIALIKGTFDEAPKLDQIVKRDPLTCRYAEWRVVKTFDAEDQRRLCAISTIMGEVVLKELFRISPFVR